MQREHKPCRNGNSLEHIADKLKVSVATAYADLRLIETNWDEFAQATHQDALPQQRPTKRRVTPSPRPHRLLEVPRQCHRSPLSPNAI